MFLALLAFAAGIALGHYTWRPPTWWLIAAVAHAAAAIRFLRMRAHFALALTLAAFVFAGAFAIEVRPKLQSAAQFDSAEAVTITAHVIGEGSLQNEATSSWRQQIDLETERIKSESGTRDNRFGLRLTVYSKSAEPEDYGGITAPHRDLVPSMRLLHYGERVRFTASLISPRNFYNPGVRLRRIFA